jgi:hypothetical protein
MRAKASALDNSHTSAKWLCSDRLNYTPQPGTAQGWVWDIRGQRTNALYTAHLAHAPMIVALACQDFLHDSEPMSEHESPWSIQPDKGLETRCEEWLLRYDRTSIAGLDRMAGM